MDGVLPFAEFFAGVGLVRSGLGSRWRCTYANDIDQSKARMYRAMFPDDPPGHLHLCDVWDTDTVASRVGSPFLATASFPCFARGTLVLAREGYKPIDDVTVGDEVLTHLGRWRRVTAVMSRRKAPLRRVRAQGVDVVTTDEHPFWARERTIERNHTRSFDDPRWVTAGELTKDHFLAQVLPDVEQDRKTVEFWWLIGRYLADGWRARRKGRPGGWTVICCAHAEADELRDRIAAAGFYSTSNATRTTVKFYITANSLHRFLEPFGHLARGKTLPGFALSLSRAKTAALLDGYMSGDGCAYRGGAKATTVSKRLAFSVALLAQRAGVVASVYRRTRTPDTIVIDGRLVRQRPTWSITVPKHNRSGFVEGRYGWKPVEGSRWHGRGTVYNLSVDEDESYMADGAIVHNCTDLSLAGMQRGLDGKSSGAFWAFALVLRRMLSEGRAPKVIMLENVHGFATGNGGRDLRAACSELSSMGYALDAFALDARHFTPASRPRLFVIGALGWEGGADQGPRPEVLKLRALSEIMESMPSVRWMGLRAPPPPELSYRVESLLDQDGDWWPDEQVAAHLAKMDPIHLARLAGPEPIVACGFRRTRRGAARLEVRTDGRAGCLRTPRGGSGRQVVVRSEGGRARMRWMTSIEYARLQGARHCGPVVSERQALFGYGDAVCVPAVSWLDREVLSPLAGYLLRPAAGAGTAPSAASPPATSLPSG